MRKAMAGASRRAIASPRRFLAVTPYAAVNAQAFVAPAYSEQDVSGGGLGLTYAGRTATDIRGEAGARFDRLTAIDPTTLLVLRGRLGWAHDWISDPTLAPVFQALPGASFIVNGATPAQDFALGSAGAELRLPHRRLAHRQIRRRVRPPRADLCRHRNNAVFLVGTASVSKAAATPRRAQPEKRRQARNVTHLPRMRLRSSAAWHGIRPNCQCGHRP